MLYYLFWILIAIILPARSWYTAKKGTKISIVWRLAEYPLFLIVLFYSLREQNLSFRSIGLTFDQPFFVSLFYIVACAALILFLNYFSFRVYVKSKNTHLPGKESSGELETNDLFSGNHPKISLILTLLYIAFAGLWEELVFRGFIFRVMAASEFPILLTVLISNLLFSINHISGGYSQVIYSFLFGLIFSVLYVLTEYLPAIILCHIIGNMHTVVVIRPKIQKIKKKEAAIYF